MDAPAEAAPDWPDVLRRSWKLAAVLQFCRMFRPALNLRPFSADMLEAALIDFDASSGFSDLMSRLMSREPLPDKHPPQDWQSQLFRRVAAGWRKSFRSNPLATSTFAELSPLRRVIMVTTVLTCHAVLCCCQHLHSTFGSQLDVMYALCEWRLEDSAYIQDQIRRAVRLAQDELILSPMGSLVPVVHLLQLFGIFPALQQTASG